MIEKIEVIAKKLYGRYMADDAIYKKAQNES